ncbi:SDR family NAD(P)-dependent oxidoreductase [Inhella sp.]|uniref:SDR family NAD(P)-dependent oxidoreductase n=1 Tax=Inhella sp. TaxID=1921806 RepID=UPI0035B49EAC
MKPSGNTIFITGGGSGIGRALAEAHHRAGNQVIISGRRKGNLEATTSANPGMASIELDVNDPASIASAVQQLTADFPDLNILINNAGIMELNDVSSRKARRTFAKVGPLQRARAFGVH